MKTSILLLVLVCVPAQAAERAVPPKKWDKATLGTFFPNAFETLQGSRPDFTAPGEVKEGGKKEEKKQEAIAHGDFDRSDLMKKLERSEESIREVLSSEGSFKAGISKVSQPLDVVVMMGKTLFHSDPDYNGDDDFLRLAEEMVSAANNMKACCKKSDYKGAGAAFARIQKSCNDCHAAFK